MKTTLLHLLFVLALTSTSLADHSPIVDTSGEPILNDAGGYYLSSTFRPIAPVQLAPIPGEFCPRTVIRPMIGSLSIAVRFTSPLRIANISTSMRVHVDFLPPQLAAFSCLPSPARWKVEEDGSVKIVEEGEQSRLFGSFRIEEIGGGQYKLQYCEQKYCEGGDDDDNCKDIGLSNDHRLIVKDGAPLLGVIFVRVSDINQYDNKSEGIKMTV